MDITTEEKTNGTPRYEDACSFSYDKQHNGNNIGVKATIRQTNGTPETRAFAFWLAETNTQNFDASTEKIVIRWRNNTDSATFEITNSNQKNGTGEIKIELIRL